MDQKITVFAVVAALLISTPAMAHEEETWIDRLDMKGDFRLRFDQEAKDNQTDRQRSRFRARVGFKAEVTDDIDFVFALASGGDNPVSTNQSLDDGFSRKDIGVDLSYIDWKINDQFGLLAGKMKNPLYRAGSVPLVWDGDLNPEGAALTYASGGLFATAAGFAVEERSGDNDSLLYAAQLGYKFPIGDSMSLTAGVGYFGYTNTIGNEPFYDGNARGNTVDVDGNYVYEYKDTEAFAEFGTKIGGWPLKIYAHYVQNNEVSEQDTAYAVGAKIGSAKADGDMEFSWTWQDLEADAVIGTFSDSDFGGGGTDSEGHMIKGKYVLAKNVALGGTLFLNTVDRASGTNSDYDRIQIDLEFMFD